jgi:hypothetical protein
MRSNAICSITISKYNELRRLSAKTRVSAVVASVISNREGIRASDLDWGMEVCDGN